MPYMYQYNYILESHISKKFSCLETSPLHNEEGLAPYLTNSLCKVVWIPATINETFRTDITRFATFLDVTMLYFWWYLDNFSLQLIVSYNIYELSKVEAERKLTSKVITVWCLPMHIIRS